MPSIALAAAGAVMTFTVGGSASQVVLEEQYAKTGCKDEDVKKQGTYVMLSSCKELDRKIDGKTHYYKYTCSGSVPTANMYTDDKCKTAAATTHNVEYQEACKKDTNNDVYTKRKCVSSSGLGTTKKYSKEACPEDSLTGESFFALAACDKTGVFTGSWTESSRKIALTDDKKNITMTNYKTLDCSGTVDGKPTTSQCGVCSKEEGADSWLKFTFPNCGEKDALVSGAACSTPGLMFKALVLMLAKIARM